MKDTNKNDETRIAKADDREPAGWERRDFLKCVGAWAGTGLVLAMSGGILSSCKLEEAVPGVLSFVQISDTHIGFGKDPNPKVADTLQALVDKINALPQRPPFLLHTGDLTHLSKPEEFDTLQQILKGVKTDQIFFVPGEHDTFSDQGAEYLKRFGKGTQGQGWQSFDHNGTHYIGLNNVVAANSPTPGTFKNGGNEGLGALGKEQLDWLQKDVTGLSSSTPIVVFAHIPLWAVYPQWGWGTEDSEQALSFLKKFGSVTVLNGHIHQVMQKVEGNITFHTARSTAYPQPAPGSAPSPGPLKDVPAGQLGKMIGVTQIRYVETDKSLAIVDSSLA
ncbi:MAG: metallophosphoesterase family protein [Pyrinomonadaceae bacterium]